MGAIIYGTAGTYTDSTNAIAVISVDNVNLTTSLVQADVFMDANDIVTATAAQVYVYVGAYGSGTIILNGSTERAYGVDGENLQVIANGNADEVFGSDSGSTSTFTLAGTSGAYFGSSGTSIVIVTGANGYVASGTGTDTVNLALATASGATIKGGTGNDVLNLIDYVGDNNALTIDVGKNTVSNGSGLTITNLKNLDYSITNPGSSTRRTASTQFTLESETNALDFSYSSGANTVYNAGSGSTSVSGGSGMDTVVGGTNYTRLGTSGGTDTLYGGLGTNVMQPSNGTGGTDRFYGGSGTDYFFGGGGTGNEYMYGAGATDYFQGGGGTNVLVEGTHSDEFHGTVGNDFIYGSSAASKVYGGSGTDYVYTGAQAQYIDSGTGKEYFEEMQGTQANGKLDVVDNFQTQGAGGKGTFIFMPTSEASSTNFVQGQGGVYVQTELGNGQSSDILVANTNNLAAVKAQTFFNL